MVLKDDYLFYGMAAIAAVLIIFAVFFSIQTIGAIAGTQEQLTHKDDHMKLTSFDSYLAKQFMDKDNNGMCDSCGMKIDDCIADGQMQCIMDSASTIGLLGSGHTHANFKVYINGEALNFAKPEYYMKSSFIHVDDNINKEDASGVLHMHAVGVPLWIFFESLGGKFNESCIALSSDNLFCNNAEKTVNFYVNVEQNNEFGNYVFNDKDKILISYGDSNEDVKTQLETITNFSRDH